MALVVYDPGPTSVLSSILGVHQSAQTVADDLAKDLQAKGYFVDLAGIDSSMARDNATQYQVVVVGGPISGGKASSAVQSYLKNISPGNETIGVYGVNSGNDNAQSNQIAPLPNGSTLTIKETFEINSTSSQSITTEGSQFINQLLN